MKVVLTQAGHKAKTCFTPIIPFDKVEKTYKKTEVLKLDLKSNPSNEDSGTYEFTIPFFKTGTPEQWLEFEDNLARVLTGQNMTTGPSKYAMTRRVLKGDSLTAFNTAANAAGTETNEHYDMVMQDMRKYIFPLKVLQRQRRYARKLRDMSIRNFVNRMVELNGFLKRFRTTVEMTEDQKRLADDDLMDALEHAIPNKWVQNMIIQDFDPLDKNTQEFIEFCERLEYIETQETEERGQKGRSSTSVTDGKPYARIPRKSSKKARFTEEWCDLHQTTNHSTSECKIVQARIKELRKEYERSGGSSKYAKKKRSRPSDTHTSISKEEVRAAVHRSLMRLKRKEEAKKAEAEANLADSESEKDDESDVEIDMENFNIDDVDIEDLKKAQKEPIDVADSSEEESDADE